MEEVMADDTYGQAHACTNPPLKETVSYQSVCGSPGGTFGLNNERELRGVSVVMTFSLLKEDEKW